MKKHRTSLIFLGLLVSVLFISFFSGGVGAFNDDIDYTFDNNSILDTENPEYYEQDTLQEFVNFNVRNATELTQTYNATYSFTNDLNGNVPSGWTDSSGEGSSFIVLTNSLDGHENYVRGTSNGGGSIYRGYNQFTPEAEGDFDLWIRTPDASDVHGIYITKGNSLADVNVMGRIQIIAEIIRVPYGNGVGGSTWISMGTLDDNTWTHVRIHFDTTTDKLSAWRDGINYIDGENFYLDNTFVDSDIDTITAIGSDVDSRLYLDAIGYTMDGFYQVNDNMIPITTTENSRKEMDKFEFSLEGVNDAYDLGDDNPSGWNDIELISGDQVNIGSYPTDINKKVLVICDSGTDTRGLNRDFSVSGEFIEVNFTHEYSVLTGTGGTNFYIDSSDDTLVVSLRMLNSGEVEWENGGWNEIFNGLTTGEVYIFNFIISYEMDACIFSYYIDGVYQDIYIFPLLATGKEGLGTVQMTNQLVTNDEVRFEIDNIGVYVEGISLADTEFSYLTLEIGKNWSFQENNILWINASGFFGIYAVDYDIGTYTVPHVAGMGQPLETVFSFHTHKGKLQLINLVNVEMTEYPTGINNTFLVFYLSDWNISLNSLSIDGVLLKEGSNEYPLEFSISNCEGYFYVVDEKLNYAVLYNDIGLEFMQARFNINDVLTENRSVQFTSDKFGGFAYLRLNYTDETSTILPFTSKKSTIGLILPQSKVLGEIIILVTDEDTLHFGTFTGYITDISLIFYPDITVSIATFSLLMVLVPLMVLIIPPIAMRQKFGNSAIVPMFILMSIVAFATQLIPIWLFFLIIVSSGVFLIGRNKVGGEF